MTIICKKCNSSFEVQSTGLRYANGSLKYLDLKGRAVRGAECVECRLLRQKNVRRDNENSYTYKYEKTRPGFLMRVYRNMKSRITGVQKLKAHLYLGKDLISKETFMEWALTHPDFLKQYADYVSSGFDIKYAPTVDRKDSTLGYTLDNMEWVTHSENSRRGAMSRHHPTSS